MFSTLQQPQDFEIVFTLAEIFFIILQFDDQFAWISSCLEAATALQIAYLQGNKMIFWLKSSESDFILHKPLISWVKEIEIVFVVHASEKSIYVELSGGIMFCPPTCLVSWSEFGVHILKWRGAGIPKKLSGSLYMRMVVDIKGTIEMSECVANSSYKVSIWCVTEGGQSTLTTSRILVTC